MKLKLFILLFSLLLIPFESEEILDAQLSEYFTSEVEEEFYQEISQVVFNYAFIEDGGCFGDGDIVSVGFGLKQLVVPVKLKKDTLTEYSVSKKTPRYIKYCCLKIAC